MADVLREYFADQEEQVIPVAGGRYDCDLCDRPGYDEDYWEEDEDRGYDCGYESGCYL